MSDGKRRLSIYSEPSGSDDAAETLLLLNETFLPYNCFAGHSENKTARSYHLKGLRELHHGYFSSETEKQEGHFQKAFGYFHLAHNFDRDYFCTREALSHVAGLLGVDAVEEGEKYANSLEPSPTINGLFLEEGKFSNPDYVCHLMHPGFYSASDLSKLEESLK